MGFAAIVTNIFNSRNPHIERKKLIMSAPISNVRPPFDQPLIDIVDYALNYTITSELAYETARYCLLDTLGCGLQALDFPACTKLLGPIVPGLTMQSGARVPGTRYELDPVTAAFNIGTI